MRHTNRRPGFANNVFPSSTPGIHESRCAALFAYVVTLFYSLCWHCTRTSERKHFGGGDCAHLVEIMYGSAIKTSTLHARLHTQTFLPR